MSDPFSRVRGVGRGRNGPGNVLGEGRGGSGWHGWGSLGRRVGISGWVLGALLGPGAVLEEVLNKPKPRGPG